MVNCTTKQPWENLTQLKWAMRKLVLISWIKYILDHKNGISSKARRPRLVTKPLYRNTIINNIKPCPFHIKLSANLFITTARLKFTKHQKNWLKIWLNALGFWIGCDGQGAGQYHVLIVEKWKFEWAKSGLFIGDRLVISSVKLIFCSSKNPQEFSLTFPNSLLLSVN